MINNSYSFNNVQLTIEIWRAGQIIGQAMAGLAGLEITPLRWTVTYCGDFWKIRSCREIVV